MVPASDRWIAGCSNSRRILSAQLAERPNALTDSGATSDRSQLQPVVSKQSLDRWSIKGDGQVVAYQIT